MKLKILFSDSGLFKNVIFRYFNFELYCDNTIYKMTDYLELEIFGDKIIKKIISVICVPKASL